MERRHGKLLDRGRGAGQTLLLSYTAQSDCDGPSGGWLGRVVQVRLRPRSLAEALLILRFLADHFAATLTVEEVPSTPDPLVPSAIHSHSDTPTTRGVHATPLYRRISSATISQPVSLSRSISSNHSLSLAPGSPLAPLRFMRKASDSPDDRRREKDNLKIGRRSILGKET